MAVEAEKAKRTPPTSMLRRWCHQRTDRVESSLTWADSSEGRLLLGGGGRISDSACPTGLRRLYVLDPARDLQAVLRISGTLYSKQVLRRDLDGNNCSLLRFW